MQGNAECTGKSHMGRTLGTQKKVFSDFSALYEGQASFSLICSFLFPLLILPQGRVFRTAVGGLRARGRQIPCELPP